MRVSLLHWCALLALVSGTIAQGGESGAGRGRLIDALSGLGSTFRPLQDVSPLIRGGPGGQVPGKGVGRPADSKPVGQCGAILNNVLSQLQFTLQGASGWTVQDAQLDWGFFGDADETATCAGQNCAYTNPNSPYGLTVLPLAPGQTLSSQLTKDLPDFVRQDYQQRNGLSAPARAVGSGFSLPGRGLRQEAGVETRAARAQGQGYSAAWQLAPDEVIVVAGCVPPANASRYFAWSHYLHSLYNEKASNWVSVFASLGDSISMYTQAPGNLGQDNRLNSSLPTTQQKSQQQAAPETRTRFGGGVSVGSWLSRVLPTTKQQTPAKESTGGSNTGGGSSGDKDSGTNNGPLLWDTLNKTPELNNLVDMMKAKTLVTPAPGDDPFDKFSVVLVTASQTSGERIKSLMSDTLDKMGFQSSINVLPIPAPFTADIGLAERNAYFMLLARNILTKEQMSLFKAYLDGNPWQAWRVSPVKSAWVSNGRPTQTTQTFAGSRDQYPPAQVIPRKASALNQSEEWLRPAMNWLLQKVDRTIKSQGATASWSLMSDSALQAAGIDWGIDCYQRKIDFCNGDNRDAQYIISLPPVTLDRTAKVMYIVGVNHVVTGTASYVNIAPSDPIQRLGLASWDDQEMKGSADPWLADGPFAGLSVNFYVVAYSRKCTGIPYCKEIPTSGARSLPLSRAMLVLQRAYVNPLTGVGPDASTLVTFRTVVSTPQNISRIRDTTALQLDSPLMGLSQCKTAITSLAVSCPQILRPRSRPDVAAANIAAAVSLGAAERAPLGDTLWNAVTGVVPALEDISQSDCCASVRTWTANKCNCNDGGQAILEALTPLPTRALLAGLGQACGQPQTVSLCI